MAGNQAELVALIQRLELVTSRLEKVPGAGGAAASSNKDAGKFCFEVFNVKWELMMRLNFPNFDSFLAPFTPRITIWRHKTYLNRIH